MSCSGGGGLELISGARPGEEIITELLTLEQVLTKRPVHSIGIVSAVVGDISGPSSLVGSYNSEIALDRSDETVENNVNNISIKSSTLAEVDFGSLVDWVNRVGKDRGRDPQFPAEEVESVGLSSDGIGVLGDSELQLPSDVKKDVT